MMEKNGINWYSVSDNTVLTTIGQFIQDIRLQQNKTQLQLAAEAGINRSTLSQIENGNGGTMLTLIQILRVLGQLQILKNFEADRKISPIQLARLEQGKRKRARNANDQTDKPDLKSGW
jgi:transcriptional regulator with XRE-family HTH domain